MKNVRGYKEYEDSKGNIITEFLHVKKGAGAHVRIVLSDTGTAQVYTVSILEDLLADYHSFKKMAIKKSQNPSPLIKRRYFRAAIVFLFAYFDAVVNSWWEYLQLRDGLPQNKKRKNFYHKFEYINSLAGINISTLKVQKLKSIRNKVVHFQIGYDLFIFDGVELSTIAECEKLVLGWIEKVGKKLDLKATIDTAELGNKLRLDITHTNSDKEYCYNQDTTDE